MDLDWRKIAEENDRLNEEEGTRIPLYLLEPIVLTEADRPAPDVIENPLWQKTMERFDAINKDPRVVDMRERVRKRAEVLGIVSPESS